MKSSDRVVLTIRVPKEIEPGPGPIVAEQIFSTLHAIADTLPFYKRLLGMRGERVSFEIIHRKKHIRFLVTTPRKYQNLVESQIYAHYPNVEIFEEPDYVPPTQKSGEAKAILVATELILTDPDILPIKRYPQFEDKLTRIAADPIAGITSALAKLNHPTDEAWLQIVVVPLDDKWRIKYTEVLRIVSNGLFGNIEKLQNAYINVACTRKVWPRVVFLPVYAFLTVRRKLAGFGNGTKPPTTEDSTSKTHESETSSRAITDKLSRPLFEVNIRLGYLSGQGEKNTAQIKVREMAGTFRQFSIPMLNEFDTAGIKNGDEMLERFRERRILNSNMLLNAEELATIYHMPSHVVQTPNIDWVKSRKVEAPTNLPAPEIEGAETLSLIGKTNYRGMHQVFGIKNEDRRRHMYIIGKTGMGKTTLLENMIFHDIQNGKGVAVIDPHGDLAERALDFVPANRTNDVIIFDPGDREFPISFNMLECNDPMLHTIVCSGLVGIFKKIYAESWGPRLEHILRNVILTLLNYPDTTMLGIPRILQDDAFRRRVVSKVEDPVVRGFWDGEFNKMNDKLRTEAIAPILNKVGQFLSSPIIRNIVGQVKSSVDLRFAMDKGKIIIVNLSKGKIGEDNSSLLGAMMITKFQLDAMSRANIPEKERKDFYLYVDEFQNFATESFATILSEARKYRLNLTMANQYIAQMPDEVRDAVFGNVGTLASFQVGYDDAEALSQQFGEVVTPQDMVNLNNYTIYTRLLVDGMPSRTFSADTLPPPEPLSKTEEEQTERREKIIKLSRERYSKPRAIVEDKIKRWSDPKNSTSSSS